MKKGLKSSLARSTANGWKPRSDRGIVGRSMCGRRGSGLPETDPAVLKGLRRVRGNITQRQFGISEISRPAPAELSGFT